MRTTPASGALQQMVAAERRELADVLASLPDDAWDAPSLCAGWRVREVVAHITMPLRFSTARFVLEMARSGGRFHAMADRCARRDAAANPTELLKSLRDNVDNPWQPPGGGLEGALTHDVVHGLDLTVPLGVHREVPAERLSVVLTGLTGPTALKHFGVDLSDVQLCADDLDWSFGSGVPVRGAAQDLALLLCGRALPPGHLSDQAPARFTRAAHGTGSAAVG